MSKWKPIETAPKSGTYVLCWNGIRVDMWHWDKQPYNTRPRPYWSRVGPWGALNDRSQQPTHWMPLPKPPTNTKSSEESREKVEELCQV